MISWLEITRPHNSAMAALGVAIGGLLVLKAASLPLLMAAAAAFLITGAGNAVNDYFDVECDRINRPRRPLPSGRMSMRGALALTLLMFGSGIAISAAINWACFLIAVLNSLLLVLYSFNLQNKLLLGNIAVSYLTGSAFIFGGAAAGDLALPGILAALSALASMARELVKDLEDVEGDRLSFMKRIASKAREAIGERFRVSRGGVKLRYKTMYAILTACFSLWLAVVASSLPYAWGMLGASYMALVIPTDALLIAASMVLIRRRDYKLTSMLIKAGMLLGLVAFLAGTFI